MKDYQAGRGADEEYRGQGAWGDAESWQLETWQGPTELWGSCEGTALGTCIWVTGFMFFASADWRSYYLFPWTKGNCGVSPAGWGLPRKGPSLPGPQCSHPLDALLAGWLGKLR